MTGSPGQPGAPGQVSGTGGLPGTPDPSTASGRRLIVALDLLRQQIVKSTAAILDNRALAHQTTTSTGTSSTSPIDPATGFPMPPGSGTSGSATPNPGATPTPVAPTPGPPAATSPAPSGGSATPKPGAQPTPITPPSPTGAGGAGANQSPGTGTPVARVVKTNELLTLILEELKSRGDHAKAVRELDPNRAAYDRRREAGQTLGKYQTDVDYRKPMHSGAGRAADDRFNRAGAGEPSRAGGVAKGAAAGGELAGLGRMLMRIFGPVGIALGLLGAALNQTISGFDTFRKTLDLFTSVLAPIFLPAFVLMSAAVLAVSMTLFDQLLPVFEDLFQVMFKLVPIIEFYLNSQMKLAELYIKLYDFIGQLISKIAQFVGQNVDFEKLLPPDWNALFKGAKEAAKDAAGAVAGEIGGKPENARGDFRKAIDLVIRSLEMQIGPKASLTQLDTDWNKKLIDALNVDPIEAEKMRNMQIIIGLLKKVVAAQNAADAAKKAEAPIRGVDGNAMAMGPLPMPQGIVFGI